MRNICVVILTSLCLIAYSQADTLYMDADTIVLGTDTMVLLADTRSQSELDCMLLEHTLQWLDSTDCVGTSDTLLLSDSVYAARLAALPCIIEMPYNQVVRRFIDMYVTRSPRQVARLRTLGGYYFPIFEDALHRNGLPEELKYLPVIESALNVRAYSRMGAAGLWQFMPSTAKLYGLEVNSLVDERLDPIKSTDAACRFLKQLYNLFGDWNLAIAAYNCGPGNVNKAIHRSGGKRDFWDIYAYLPRETRSYLPIFIAANYAMNYADSHQICPAQTDYTLATDTIVTDRRLHLKQVADVLSMSIDELRRLNPQYRMDILPGGKPYSLVLPIELTGTYIDLQDSIFNYMADSLILNRRKQIDMAQKTAADGFPATGMYYYTVKKGDVLGSIAKRQRTTVANIKKWNGLKNDNIRVGQKLKLYR